MDQCWVNIGSIQISFNTFFEKLSAALSTMSKNLFGRTQNAGQKSKNVEIGIKKSCLASAIAGHYNLWTLSTNLNCHSNAGDTLEVSWTRKHRTHHSYEPGYSLTNDSSYPTSESTLWQFGFPVPRWDDCLKATLAHAYRSDALIHKRWAFRPRPNRGVCTIWLPMNCHMLDYPRNHVLVLHRQGIGS